MKGISNNQFVGTVAQSVLHEETRNQWLWAGLVAKKLHAISSCKVSGRRSWPTHPILRIKTFSTNESLFQKLPGSETGHSTPKTNEFATFVLVKSIISKRRMILIWTSADAVFILVHLLHANKKEVLLLSVIEKSAYFLCSPLEPVATSATSRRQPNETAVKGHKQDSGNTHSQY